MAKIGMFWRTAASAARSGSSPVLDRPSVARTSAGDRLAAMGREHALDRVAERRDGSLGLDGLELPPPRRLARAVPGRGFEVMEIQFSAPAEGLQIAG